MTNIKRNKAILSLVILLLTTALPLSAQLKREGLIFSEVYLNENKPGKSWVEIYNPTNMTLTLEKFRTSNVLTTNILPEEIKDKGGIEVVPGATVVLCADKNKLNCNSNTQIIQIEGLNNLKIQNSAEYQLKNGSSKKFLYGVKGGIGFWIPSFFDKGVEYSFPLGFMGGIFCENYISQDLSILNELYFQNSITKIKIYPDLNDNLQQKLITQYLHLPVLIKYQTRLLWDTYFNLGSSFSYLINSEYYYHFEYGFDGNKNVTDKIPKFNVAIEFGFGERIKLNHSFLYLELRTQVSLTKIQPKDFDNLSVGEWRNSALIFLIGYTL
ncbi:MAG: porin family protein [Ignavibacteria bacterium]|jgi:hypothetical protein